MADKADLHIHTTFSDGALAPSEVVAKAKAAGLSAISITDHDAVSGIDEAVEAGDRLGINVIAGIELSACIDEREIHILGYFINPRHPRLVDSVTRYRELRLERAARIVSKLNEMNIPLTLDSVLAQAGEGAVGRVHIANAMVNDGHAPSYSQVFSKYIGDGKPAYEKKAEVSPADTIRLITEAGGVAILAHPGKYVNDEDLVQLLDAGIDGIEVIHPSHTPERVQFYRKLVNEYFLLETGGSDFHGGMRGDDAALGHVTIGTEAVDAIQRRLFARGEAR